MDESGSGRDRKRIGLIEREKKIIIESKILFPNFSSIYLKKLLISSSMKDIKFIVVMIIAEIAILMLTEYRWWVREICEPWLRLEQCLQKIGDV